MAEVCLAFLDHAKDYYPTGNEYNNFTQAVKPISELYSMLPAKKFGPVEFRTTRAWWLNRETSRKVGKCSRKTINEQMNRVKRLIKWAVAEGMVEVSVYETLRCVESLKKGRCTAPESKPVKPVDKATVDATLPHLTTVVADMVRVQLLLGCRPGELCKLTPSMFNTTEGIWEIFLEEHKTAHRGKERIIYVGPQAQEILKKYLNRDPDAALFSPAESEQERRDKVHQKRRTKMSCGNRPGSNKSLAPKRAPRTSFDAHSYTRSIANGCKKGKIPIWTANQLRHTRATEIRKRFGLEAAASVLGHSEIGVTQVYAEADMQRAIEVVRLTG
jgi:integrase